MTNAKSPAKFEDILSHIDSGPWTWMIFVLTSVWGLFGAMQAVSAVFLSPPTEHWCHSDVTNITWTQEQRKNISIPWDSTKAEYSSCLMYNRSYSELEGLDFQDAMSLVDPSSPLMPCKAWDYNTTVFKSTIISEWDLVCEREYLRSLVQSTFMAGVFVSSPINGLLADRFGRKRVLSVALFVFLAVSVLGAMVLWFPVFLFCRFLMALSGHCVYQTSYIIAVETCSIRHRSTVGILFSVPFALGYILLPGIAYFIRDWRYLHCAISFPVFLLIINTVLLPESPRWLIQTGNSVAAAKELQRAARWNRQPPLDQAWLEDTIAEILQRQTKQPPSSQGDKKVSFQDADHDSVHRKTVSAPFLALFNTPVMLKMTLVLSVTWLTCTLVYYGISMNSANLSADPFLYMVLGGLVELPCYILGGPIVKAVGRRLTIIVSLLITGLAILGPLTIPQGEKTSWLFLSVVMVGKCSVTLAFQVLYLYTSELYPTCIRTQGLGVTSMVGRCGAIISPFITDTLGGVWWGFPSLIFGGCSVITGVLTCLLPETVSQELPDTLQQLQITSSAAENRSDAAPTAAENSQLLVPTDNIDLPALQHKDTEPQYDHQRQTEEKPLSC